MKLNLSRELLLGPLQSVVGVVERRQTMPILANVMFSVKEGRLSVTATDLEVELLAHTPVPESSEGEITLPARKLLDIIRSLPDESNVAIEVVDGKAQISSGRSRFALATLPATEFPAVESGNALVSFTISQRDLRHLLEQTHFAMAQQDVRYYLNGLLLEFREDILRGVATDGHRLSLCDVPAAIGAAEMNQVIVPRKGVMELQRLLEDTDAQVKVEVSNNHVRISFDELRFTSKLVDGRFPDYERVIPKGGQNVMQVGRKDLRQSLGRAAILSNEKYRGVRLTLSAGKLSLQAQNPEQESAEEDVEVSYDGDEIEIGFNVGYLLDPLAALDSDEIEMTLIDGNSSCVISSPGETLNAHIVMPMRL